MDYEDKLKGNGSSVGMSDASKSKRKTREKSNLDQLPPGSRSDVPKSKRKKQKTREQSNLDQLPPGSRSNVSKSKRKTREQSNLDQLPPGSSLAPRVRRQRCATRESPCRPMFQPNDLVYTPTTRRVIYRVVNIDDGAAWLVRHNVRTKEATSGTFKVSLSLLSIASKHTTVGLG